MKTNREQELDEEDFAWLKNHEKICVNYGCEATYLQGKLKGIREERKRIRKMLEDDHLGRKDILRNLDG
jgi:hypothetical protein